ncbi:MAG: hypothetical protein R1F54_05500 [Candidatus Zeuxoniibacter abyssi]|nr:MAG: hypothetical protein R1F54_05500 [Candidatus Persebacteraceae bacterium AB1(2)]
MRRTKRVGGFLAQDGFAVHSGLSAFSVQGKNSVQSVRAKAGERSLHINCDCVLMNAGRTPITELPAAAGVVFTYNENLHTLSADDKNSPTGVVLAGAVGGCLSLNAAVADGEAAATATKRPPKDAAVLPSNPVYVNAKKHRGMAFIDFDEDLQPKDFDEAIDEGFDDIQLLKRYTTAGMGRTRQAWQSFGSASSGATTGKARFRRGTGHRPPAGNGGNFRSIGRLSFATASLKCPTPTAQAFVRVFYERRFLASPGNL